MSREKAWVQSLQLRLQASFEEWGTERWRVDVGAGEGLTYAHEIFLYRTQKTQEQASRRYETDLLVK